MTGRLGVVVRFRMMVMESMLAGDFEPSIVNFILPAPLCWHQASQCPLVSDPQGHGLALLNPRGG